MIPRPISYSSLFTPVEDELTQVIATLGMVASTDESVARSAGSDALAAQIEHILGVPGKRVRPAITLLSARVSGNQDPPKAITMATAVELLHIATLVHDDTVDSADLRRGRATASNLWGRNVAILLGDYLFAASARFVCATGNVQVVDRFAATIMELSKGELTELLDAGNPGVGRAAYLDRIFNKTASLFMTASESGAVLGGADPERAKHLREFGYNLGMAYQVMDDLLDFDSTREQLGKPAGHDLANGVLTLPAIILMERIGPENPIAKFLASSPDDRKLEMERAIREIRSRGILDECRSVVEGYVRAAQASLSTFAPSAELESLTALAEFAGTRQS
ncbi:MAG: polyprenyl synthetase family protein [SAR202 cluster bacterium]|nr:polyprenyl synthetase family protein [SAR202 cluster bacterium]